MEKQSVIVIFDVGKTNKKLLLFNEDYELVFEASTQLPETQDEDGFPCEDVHALTDWVRTSFENILVDERFEVKAVNFSAYGASLVFVDDDLQPLLPLYNYLKPYPEDLKRKFYAQYGGTSEFSIKTASPVLGSLNSGMQLYRLKHENPEMYAKTKCALHLPQYLSSILTKMVYSEITSIGCHTNLWDFTGEDYHSWVYEEGIREKLAPILRSNTYISIHYLGKSISVGIGMHDSSAALVPYLTSFDDPFVLISTGTWCISLNPFNTTPLSQIDLENDCLFYLTYEGRPVKASRLFAGYEHEHQSKKLASYYKVPLEQITNIAYNPVATSSSKAGATSETISTRKTSADVNEIITREIETAEQAYHDLIIDIVAKQLISTKHVMKGSEVKRIFIDGGFSKNSIYMNLMAAVLPGVKIYAASVAQASAVGAAVVIHSRWNQKPLPTNLIDLNFYKDATRD